MLQSLVSTLLTRVLLCTVFGKHIECRLTILFYKIISFHNGIYFKGFGSERKFSMIEKNNFVRSATLQEVYPEAGLGMMGEDGIASDIWRLFGLWCLQLISSLAWTVCLFPCFFWLWQHLSCP